MVRITACYSVGSFCALLLAFVLAIDLQAQGPPIFTDTPIMLGLEGSGIRTFGRYISKENSGVYRHIIALPFNITAKWQVGGIVPFVHTSPEGLENRFGVGDMKIFSKYLLYQKDSKRKTFRTLIKLIQGFPTGSSSGSPQLGNGAWESTIGFVNGYVTTEYGIYGEFAYSFTSDGLPDKVIYNVAFGLPLLPQQYPPKQVNLFLEMNGNHIPESGNNILLLSPGIQWITGRRLLLETGIQLPLIEEGAEGETTNFRYTLGMRILIF